LEVNPMISRLVRFFVAFVVAFLTACGSDDATGPGSGSFTATVSGDVNASLSGNAVFGVGLYIGSDSGWSIWLLEGSFFSDYDFITIDRSSSAAPGVGAFTIIGRSGAGPDDFVAKFEHALEEGSNIEITGYTSVSGSLTITSATADQIEGSFSFTGSGPGPGQTVTVQGSFSAKPGPF